MVKLLQKAKHWHLFLLIVGIPFLVYIGWLVSFITEIMDTAFYESNEFPVDMFNGIITMMLLMMIPVAVQYAWFWSMGIGLQKKLPDGMKMNVGLFKAFFIIPIVYFLLYMLFTVSFFGSIENIEQLEYIEDFENFGLFIGGMLLFVGLSFFVTFCTFYQYWFIAKTVKSAQLQKEVKFGEFVGEFFLLWFSFVGVWIIQPVVNKLVESDEV